MELGDFQLQGASSLCNKADNPGASVAAYGAATYTVSERVSDGR